MSLDMVRKWYPRARTSVDTVNRLLDTIDRVLGLKPHQLMHADSLCCDDVNAIQYPPRALEMLGPFHLGGLDGYPFAGITGMNAFAHHVPEDGAVIIFYAPHIGVTKQGALGEISRIGQGAPSACCGAAKGALEKLKRNEIIVGNISSLDFQMNTIEQIFLSQKQRILRADHPLFEATEVMYEAIDDRIEVLVKATHYPCKYLLLVGGIFINGDKEMGSYCQYKKFDCIDIESGERRSLLAEYDAI
ncbi:hypothetical protein Lbys_0913 [Leadbetterella byssophila DSM 17132]|uniref:Limiting CO2-inducible protein B/C beta carbonyic anhydrase domain-containing protein n=1 Tax=Leadbetterella byssophila (strain DSM 17132 / JCM 16389 / KACC 11308 / NBRC 106382 / 4M15) TaxID=649349 RepID=E4RRJ8_LEAB4|nr:hypothetical protein [Leadbetterella byssophila]ADQ16654.1 hypothetical protein Lbys_0913 [Leadbetterella byssophila DSM 17132]